MLSMRYYQNTLWWFEWICLLQSWVFEHLVPSCWCYVGKFKWCSLPRGRTALWLGLEMKSLELLPVFHLCFMLVVAGVSSQLHASAVGLLFAVTPPHCDGHISLQNHKPKKPFLTVPYSWCFFRKITYTVIDQQTQDSQFRCMYFIFHVLCLNWFFSWIAFAKVVYITPDYKTQ